MNSVSPVRSGTSGAAVDATTSLDTFWNGMDSNKRAKPACSAEFARVFRARPRYRRRVLESPQATGDGPAA